MRFFYTLGILLYWFAIWLVSPFMNKAKKTLQGRKNWKKDLQNNWKKTKKTYWFHCSSLGEFEQARPVLERLKEQKDIAVFLSFFSPSGYEIRKDYAFADYVCYLPADTPRNARDFLDIVQPDVAVFVKYEFWYNYIYQTHKKSIPLYYFSVIFRPSQHFFKFWGKWFTKHLKMINQLFVQNETSVELAKKIGLKNIRLCGDTRFDRVFSIAQNPKDYPFIQEFINEKKCILMGSSWLPDDKMMAAVFQNYKGKIKLIIAPHHTDESRIKQIESLFPNSICFTNIQKEGLNEKDKDKDVMIIDTIGILSSLYRYADVAFIGNGFGSGIHNTLEAAVYGLPLVFGPHYHKFQEAVDLVEKSGAFSFNNAETLNKYLNNLLFNQEMYNNASSVCKEYVQQNLGATEKIVSVILKENFD
jgi:3-deoxy-D-manno-octulosonic-acid transferase